MMHISIESININLTLAKRKLHPRFQNLANLLENEKNGLEREKVEALIRYFENLLSIKSQMLSRKLDQFLQREFGRVIDTEISDMMNLLQSTIRHILTHTDSPENQGREIGSEVSPPEFLKKKGFTNFRVNLDEIKVSEIRDMIEYLRVYNEYRVASIISQITSLAADLPVGISQRVNSALTTIVSP